MPFHRKNTRLAPKNYFGRQTYFVTLCCDRRAPHLAEANHARGVLDLLFECASSHSFRLHAYCIMPDHLHILTEGIQDSSDLREFVRLLKQRTAFDFRKSRDRRLWESSYYDHILRSTDVIEEVAAYIWWNPVRRKLCDEPHEYPFSGSQTIDWIRRSLLGTRWLAPWKRKSPA